MTSPRCPQRVMSLSNTSLLSAPGWNNTCKPSFKRGLKGRGRGWGGRGLGPIGSIGPTGPGSHMAPQGPTGVEVVPVVWVVEGNLAPIWRRQSDNLEAWPIWSNLASTNLAANYQAGPRQTGPRQIGIRLLDANLAVWQPGALLPNYIRLPS